MTSEYLGTDILFDADGDFLVSPTGDLTLVRGNDCLLQDVCDRLETAPGDLYSHPDWGCRIKELLGAPDSPLNRALAVRYLKLAILADNRIKTESLQISVLNFGNEYKEFEIRFTARNSSTPDSLVWGFGLTALPLESI